MISSPLLACKLLPSDIPHTDDNIIQAMSKLTYPVMATLKLDGILSLTMPDIILASRTFKWIPNVSLCARALSLPQGLQMELFNPLLDYNDIQSIVMSETHPRSDEIQFHLLDTFAHKNYTYINRCNQLAHINLYLKEKTHFQFPVTCNDHHALFSLFLEYEKSGEGICFRLPSSVYKEGRSTLKEQILIKFCRYIHSECIITGFEEQKANTNCEGRHATGKMNRSKRLAGMVGKATLGALLVKDNNGMEFRVGNGVGLDDKLREKIYLNQDKYLGKTIVVRSKNHGVKIKPRSPVFWGFREEGY